MNSRAASGVALGEDETNNPHRDMGSPARERAPQN
eukprot:CAMPEP_0114295368 /NCGR_PEP_ID=MMETSP0059-20121206/10652_1 /TAXON_ID=36894 /ORGANISM="Pyramimonas parkeae, Strain CCMP726" /LENGTH=34 /DNA_ID= /DNA_START= /DNA_END= /DNA_ORIENTATION=